MSGKKLSNGTLGLRFMQNAQRAKQLKEVVLEKAHIEDDGQWEIAKEIRESWGPTQSDITVSYEQSYLPFLFPSLSASDSSSADTLPKGRRVFKRGKEVQIAGESSSTSSSTGPPAEPPFDPTSDPPSIHSKPQNRSTSGRPIVKSTKVAKLAIFDNSQVGTDLRPPTSQSSHSLLASSSSKTAGPTKNVFLKPTGVDAPNASKSSTHSASLEEEGIISGAREVKVKRERKSSTTLTDVEDGPKRKKKKPKAQSAAD